MSRSDYWESTPAEVGLIYEINRPKHIGHLHEDDVEALEVRRLKLQSEGMVVG